MSVPQPADPVRFAYWVPNVSGGLFTSRIEQRTDWGYDYNRELAVLAENNGFDHALSQVRYMASYGAEYQHESTSFSLALLLATERLKVIAAVHPGLWHPCVLAKLGATADHLSKGRFAVNVDSGWFKDEFTALGEPWLEHDERYRRSEEFIRGDPARHGAGGRGVAALEDLRVRALGGVDYALRPVLSSMGAAHITQGWFVLDRNITVSADGTLTVQGADAEALGTTAAAPESHAPVAVHG
ncbi:LLM class flavin-dependent oxidoreductase [Streptomyces sp. NBC_01520]|uniref:LLM class flavin-dependent oxidoreductase n=1 Tax=Streptomyces sp. NBC_01520 TaxID=2903892 RepID=UPI00386E631B